MIIEQFEIIRNDSRKQFEFISKSNDYNSYTVSFNECSDIKDAKLAVLAAIQAQAERNVDTVLIKAGFDPVYIGKKGEEIAKKYLPINQTPQQ